MFDYVFSTVLLQIGELAEGIFEVGFWTAIVLIAIVVAVGYWIFKKLRGR